MKRPSESGMTKVQLAKYASCVRLRMLALKVAAHKEIGKIHRSEWQRICLK